VASRWSKTDKRHATTGIVPSQFVPREIAEGDELHFGASTRRYTLKRRPSSSNDRSRKRSVSWPDEADAAGELPCCRLRMVQCARCTCIEGSVPKLIASSDRK
jgi:hypothetical protein